MSGARPDRRDQSQRGSTLAVTRIAARQFPDVVLGDQTASDGLLVGGRDVISAEDGGARTDVRLGMAMAVDAPCHLQRLLLLHERHAVHLSVARRASDAFAD